MSTHSVCRPHTSATIKRYLQLLAGGDGVGLLDVRYRCGTTAMRQAFYPVSRLAVAARMIATVGARTDIFVGVVPRLRRAGGKDAINEAHIVWVDCDTPEATSALCELAPPPSVLIASGTPGNSHAYWRLDRPAPAAEIERANRRLADVLGACRASVDVARILRPPATMNFKHTPPLPVTLEAFDATLNYEISDLAGGLADPPQGGPGGARSVASDPWNDTDACLRAIAPADYVPRLIGVTPDRAGKVTCPFHEDRTPSLQLYAEDWFCFGCRRGGSIYDFAGHLWNISPRGRGIWRLRELLASRLGVTP